MLRQKLAKKLILAKSEMVRKTLLRENQSQADEKLALAIKEICYAAWTTEPTKAQSAACALQSLVKFNPNNEIKAFSFWVSGIAEITKGKLESAIKNLDKSADIFRSINKEHEAAQTQNSKIYALALIGSYDEAIEIGKNILKVFEKYGDEFTAGKIEHNIGNIFYRRDYYKQAQQYYEVARKRYSKLNDQKHIIMVENSLAVVLALQNDFGKAEKLYQKTLKRAKAEEMFVTQAEIEASMGNLAFFRGKLDQALNFLELSRQKYENLKMPHQSSVAELEIANIYLELNLAEEAFSIYEKVTKELHTLKMQSEEAQARANFGRVATLLNETNIAKDELKKSARLYVAEKNKIGAAVVKLTQANLELNSQKYKNALILVKEAEK